MNLISGMPGHFCSLSVSENILNEHAKEVRNPARTTNTCWTFCTKVPQRQLIIISCELQKIIQDFHMPFVGPLPSAVIYLPCTKWLNVNDAKMDRQIHDDNNNKN